ncbi:helix-turn-helix transcriptional regulator [Youhaiella tibetensis]|uniref:Response regulator transcription factor n=1 Tax=Paradevosia tibetensis TaxID=1447062 RepID=A0A5B9DKX7_9HYPH|nr:response regulator transcription factor [Youhaiella tibetensis]AKR58175.1 LuxR family transcriptional regulator [Devosia sp. H5989]QEE19038.1 response regulator transcription factor [Youhaiella tibetensis]GGF36867.1 helix-turn-helix transcriptional regulator [Youhaiella tibetensis]HWK81489.1 response regulator transcription factor [Thermomicrobiales bacterium]
MFHTTATFVGHGRSSAPSHRAIVFVDPADSISDRHVDAIESAFPWTTVTKVEAVSALFESYRDIVALIIVHPSVLDDAARLAREIGDRHPLALLSVLDSGKQELPSGIVSSRFVRGVLPIGSKGDLWLSVVGLMLRGGEYFPRDLLDNHRVQSEQSEPEAPVVAAKPGVPAALSHLTAREMEVLELVSRGLQNKTIASSLNLSEYTVKIHVHNVISKLRTHNRTQAAAYYRDSTSGYAGQA